MIEHITNMENKNVCCFHVSENFESGTDSKHQTRQLHYNCDVNVDYSSPLSPISLVSQNIDHEDCFIKVPTKTYLLPSPPGTTHNTPDDFGGNPTTIAPVAQKLPRIRVKFSGINYALLDDTTSLESQPTQTDTSPSPPIRTRKRKSRNKETLDDEGYDDCSASGHRRARRSRKVGLKNLGNTCFTNAVIQVLSHTIPLRDWFLERRLDADSASSRSPSPLRGPRTRRSARLEQASYSENIEINITAVFSSLIRSLWTPKKVSKVISPYQFFGQIAHATPMFRGYQQQDAQEFLHCVLNCLHNEMSTTDNSTIITDLFQGELWDEITCKKCGNVSVKSDPFLDLSLDIPEHVSPSLHGCLENFTAPCEAEWFCQRCGVSTNGEKTLKLGICPTILCLHLKRFRWNPGRRRKQKLNEFIEFPLYRLDVSEWICIDFDKRSCGLYDCYAIVVHHGQGINSGHYTAFVLGIENQWYHINDEKVIPVSLELVRNVRAYMLFYKQRD